MPDIPKCANAVEGICPRSDTYVEKEGDTFFTIRCRTCKGINVFPKDKSEAAGKYEAFLKQKALQQQQEEALKRKKAYSY